MAARVLACAPCHGAMFAKFGGLVSLGLNFARSGHLVLMRNIAGRMTPQEIDEAARYYSSQPVFAAQIK